MSKLEVFENKTLVMKQIIKYDLEHISFHEFDQKLQFFIQKLKSLKVDVYGPLITHLKGTTISDTGDIKADYEIFIQAKNYLNFKDEFVLMHTHRFDNCICLHFEDHPKYFDFAHQKLQIYLYENDLTSNGSIITVLIDDQSTKLKADLFIPIVGSNYEVL